MWSFLALGLLACTGQPQSPAADGETPISSALLSEGQLASTWQVQVASNEGLAPFLAGAGWATLVMERDLPRAVQQLGEMGGLAAVRGHIEAAALFHRATAVVAAANVTTYRDYRVPTDAPEAGQIAAYSLGFLSDAPTQGTGPLADRLPDPMAPGTVPTADGPATWSVIDGAPDFVLAENSDAGTSAEIVSPLSYWVPSAQHELSAFGTEGAPSLAISLALAPWRTLGAPGAPSLAVGPQPVDAPLELLFGGDATSMADLQFMALLHAEGWDVAYGAMGEGSVLAAVMNCERTETGALNASGISSCAMRVSEELLAASVAAAGEELPHHRTFAQVAHAGLMRLAARAADRSGEGETAGLLRLQAREYSGGPAGNPVGLLDLVAFDAANENVARAPEILHLLQRRIPSLQKARYGLDALSLRVGRSGVSKTPGM